MKPTNSLFKLNLALIVALSLLACWPTQPTSAQVSTQACTGFPMTVATENELNSAIACFNTLTAAGTYTISLTADILLSAASLPVDNNPASSNITDSIFLLIEGNGHTVDGQDIPGVRPFTFNDGSPLDVYPLVTLQNLTITGGNVTGGGAGIEGLGGGIFSQVPLTLTNVSLIENQADSSGGLYAYPTLFIQNSAILSNTAVEVGGGLGTDATGVISSTLFQGNKAGTTGGAIHKIETPLTIYRSDFSGNRAQSGGAILNQSSVTIYDSAFSGNIATGNGGAIHNEQSITIYSSTFSGNTAAGEGGGLYNGNQFIISVPAATLFNSTFSANTANRGGGLYIKRNNGGVSPASLNHITLSGNVATTGGGLYIDVEDAGPLFQVQAATTKVSLQNSIVANSSGGDCFLQDAAGFTDLGYNLVEDGTCITAGTSFNGDPKLGPLANNGGPATPTHTLLPGSPALDAIPGGSCPLNADQRGVSRPQNGGCDLGALEWQAFSLTRSGGNNQTAAVNSIFAQPLQISLLVSGTTVGLPGQIVSLTAPASGAGLAQTLYSATTNNSGLASLLVAANAISGSYEVTATAQGMPGSALFNLTNIKSNNLVYLPFVLKN